MEQRLAAVQDPTQWQALVHDACGPVKDPAKQIERLMAVLRGDIQANLGVAALHVEHVRSLPVATAWRTYAQTRHTRHMRGYTPTPVIPWADARPFAAAVVTDVTTGGIG